SVAAVHAEAARLPTNRAERAVLIGAAVRDSVSAHLLADVEVGVFLSAGIDSGAILGLARDAGLTRTRAITVSFDSGACGSEDEAPLAAEVAQAYGAEHVVRRVNETEFSIDLPAILNAMDQPSIDGVNTWFVAKAAREAGLKVALSGIGGDELLAGYPSFLNMPAWRRRYGPLASVPGLGRLALVLMGALVPGVLRRSPKAAGMLLHAGSLEGTYLLRRGLFLPHELPAFIDPDLVAEGLRELRPLERLRATLTPDPGSETARVGVLESCHYMRDQLLRDADWAGMAHSVEIRTPLADSALLALVAPLTSALEPGEGKAALASAPFKPLPPAVATRAKTGFDTPLGAWMETLLKEQQAVENRGGVSRRWAKHLLAAQRMMPTAP
ncbi:MAG: asparagine synthase, partial [Rhodobacter sp. CACIA14H1]